MQDTEPMHVVEAPQQVAEAPQAPVARGRWAPSPSVAFVAGAVLALFIACVWMHVELSGLRADVREARQAATRAELAADRLAAASARPADPDATAAESPNASEDALQEPSEAALQAEREAALQTPSEATPETAPAAERVALHTRIITGIRARLHALRTFVRDLTHANAAVRHSSP